MAKIHKGIGIADGFAYKGKALNFSRDVYDNFTDLKADEQKYGFPEGFKTVVKNPTDNADFSFDAYKWGTFIYTNSEWRLASYVDIDSYLTFSASNTLNLNNVSGISSSGDPTPGEVWTTNGGTTNLDKYTLKTDLSNYVTTSILNTTLSNYAKLNNPANFSSLTVGNEAVATQTWTDTKINTALTQALTYKGGIAAQTDITKAEAEGTIKVGNVYVCTKAENYTINGSTVYLETGDTLICKSITGTEKWNIVQANITGAVTKSSNLASGQLVVGTGLSSVKTLATGANGKFLKVDNNTLAWGDAPEYAVYNGTKSGLVPYQEDAKGTDLFLNITGNWEKPKVSAATGDTYGGIKIGYSSKGKNYAVQIGTDGKAFVNVPWVNTDTQYTLPSATTTALGGIKLGSTVSGVDPDTGSYFYLQKDTNNVGYIDLSGAELTDTTYVEGDGISIYSDHVTGTNTISNSGVREIRQPTAAANKLIVNTGGTEKEIVINDVAHATSADSANSATTAATATKVANALTIKNYNDEGSAIDTVTYNGSVANITIECVTVADINKLFPTS